MSDPYPNAFVAALSWLNGALTGTLAITMATIAVASIGFLLLSGRVDIRRAGQVLFGCFILFGASTIAAGIVGALGGQNTAPEVLSPPPPPVSVAPANASAQPYDPYAGAALPPPR